MATMTWAERGIKVAADEAKWKAENEQRAIIAARFVAEGRNGQPKRDIALALAEAQQWGYGYAVCSLDLARQAGMLKIAECREVGCKGTSALRQSALVHEHLAAV